MSLLELLQSAKGMELSFTSQMEAPDPDISHITNRSQSLFHKLCNSDSESNMVFLDHCYAKPWNAHPESNHARPAKMLFMKGIIFNPVLDGPSRDEVVDVESYSPCASPPYEISKASIAMKECERFLNSTVKDDTSLDNWEESIPKQSWNMTKKRVFNKVLKIMQCDRLSRLVYINNPNEPVMRRLSVDKTTSRFRQLYASVGWDMSLLQWLHTILTDYLPKMYLIAYLDVLQTLKSKAPALVDKIILGGRCVDGFNQLLRRPWDPVASLLNHNKMKKVIGSPLILWTPGDPAYSCVGLSKRMKFWHTQLSSIGKLITVNPQVNQGVTIGESLDAIVTAVRYEVMELKLNFPSRPIVLVGWTIGALIACQVALVEHVTAVVCLGFPLTGVNGSRGDLDDPLLESKTPTLFIVGQNANMCSVDDIEDFRERMRAESGLVVIGGGDDHLRISGIKKKLEGITQVMADRCIVEEMAEFLNYVISHPTVSETFSPILKTEVQKKKRKSSKDAIKEIEVIQKKPRARRKSGYGTQSATSSALPSGNVSPSSSTTETSSSGSSIMDLTVERSSRFHQTKKASVMESVSKRGRFQRSFPNTHFIPPPQEETNAEQSLSYFSQQLGLPGISSSLSSPTPSFLHNKQNMDNVCSILPKDISPPALQAVTLNIGSLSSFSHYRQNQPITSASKLPLSVTQSLSGNPISTTLEMATNPISMLPLPSMVKKILPVSPLKSGSLLSNHLLAPKSSYLNSKQGSGNISYLTLANPMLSNILDGNTSSLLSTSRNSSAFITSSNSDFSLKKSVGTEGLKTYMRTPNLNTPKSQYPKSNMQLSSVPTPIKPSKPTVLMSSANADKKTYILANLPKTSLLQSTLTSAQNAATRKMQVITFLKPPAVVAKDNTDDSQVVVKTPEQPVPEKSDVNDLTAFTCALTSTINSKTYSTTQLKDSSFCVMPENRETLDAVENENSAKSSSTVSELAVDDETPNEASFTDRLSHLSAGTQEAILALTQLSDLAEASVQPYDN